MSLSGIFRRASGHEYIWLRFRAVATQILYAGLRSESVPVILNGRGGALLHYLHTHRHGSGCSAIARERAYGLRRPFSVSPVCAYQRIERWSYVSEPAEPRGIMHSLGRADGRRIVHPHCFPKNIVSWGKQQKAPALRLVPFTLLPRSASIPRCTVSINREAALCKSWAVDSRLCVAELHTRMFHRESYCEL